MAESKKYALIGGYIYSPNDGDRHYISARKLVDLYELDINDCILVDTDNQYVLLGGAMGIKKLYPREDGNYQTRAFKND